MGDFNIHLDDSTNADTKFFIDRLELLGLQQHVKEPTHIQGHTLNLVITRRAESLVARPPRVCHFFSDHATVHCDINTTKPMSKVKKISYRKVKAVNIDSLKSDPALFELCESGQAPIESCNDLDILVHNYNHSLGNIMHRHAPLKTNIVRDRVRVPWYNADIAEAKRQRRKAERR
jgi:hypothetical protein